MGNVSPPLSLSEIPAKTVTLAIIMDDPDAPRGTFTHWLVWNLPAQTTTFPENVLPDGARVGRNDYGDIGYGGPRPPTGTHRYYFHAYALDRALDLPKGASRQELERALETHVIENANYMGRFTAPAAK